MIYTENMHWGYVWNAPEGVQTTSIPTLGLVYLTGGEQSNATRERFTQIMSVIFVRIHGHEPRPHLSSRHHSMGAGSFARIWQRLIEVDGAALWVLMFPMGMPMISVLHRPWW